MKFFPLATALLLLQVAVIVPLVSCGDAPVIDLLNGRVKGEEKESRDDRDFYAYRGIPYAKPPVGDLRFESPQKPDNWTGVWDGEDYGKKCIQWSTYEKEVDGDENCLSINVFTPKVKELLYFVCISYEIQKNIFRFPRLVMESAKSCFRFWFIFTVGILWREPRKYTELIISWIMMWWLLHLTIAWEHLV